MRWIGGLALLVLAAVAILAVVARRGVLSAHLARYLARSRAEDEAHIAEAIARRSSAEYEASEYRYIADTADARCKERELVEGLLRDPDQIVQGYIDLATARLWGE